MAELAGCGVKLVSDGLAGETLHFHENLFPVLACRNHFLRSQVSIEAGSEKVQHIRVVGNRPAIFDKRFLDMFVVSVFCHCS